jgi:flagellar biosynthesis anti-sigma factor FlgM
MKIDGHGPNPLASPPEAQSAQANERVQAGRLDLGARAVESGADRVEVSADARLLTDAVRAAERAPDVRPEVVEQARQKLLAGEIGRDPLRLADSIIDSLLSH